MKISSGTKCIRPAEPFDTGNFYLLSKGSVSECGNLYDINSKKKLYTAQPLGNFLYLYICMYAGLGVTIIKK